VSTALPLTDALLGFAGERRKALDLALGGGEDYVLLATIAAHRRRAFERALARRGLHASFIGTLAPRHRRHTHQVTVDSQPMKKQTGFMHFR
jgi:thiamine monophosphate kinase